MNICEAALQIVSERGSLAMTLAEVGERAGYSRSLPAHYFGSKDGLVAALAEYMIERFGRAVLQKPKPPKGLGSVLARIDVYLSAAAEDPMQFRALQILMTEAITGNTSVDTQKSVMGANNAVAGYFERHLRIAIAEGEVRPDLACHETAVLCVAILRGTLAIWFLDARVDIHAVKQTALSHVRAMLLP